MLWKFNLKIAAINEEKMELERLHLSRVDSMDIIDYIKQSVEILMSMREDEFVNYNKNWKLQEQLRYNKQNRQNDKPDN